MRRCFEYPDPRAPRGLATVWAFTYRMDGPEAVFVEKYRDPRTGSTEREILRVAVEKRDIVKLR